MTSAEINNQVTSWPLWLRELKDEGKTVLFSSEGSAWMRFHQYAMQRFPPHDMSNVSVAERREVFRSGRILMLSYHFLPTTENPPNAFLYLCADKEFGIDSLSSNNRSKVRRGLRRFEIRRVRPDEIASGGYEAYLDTCTRNGLEPISLEAFQKKWSKAGEPTSREIWAAFAGEEIAAVGNVWRCGKWAELMSTQSADRFLSDYVNHALFFTIIQDLMQRDEIESVSYGLSSVQPGSKIESLHHFKLSVGLQAIPVFRKIEVNPWLRPVVNGVSLKAFRLVERVFPRSRHILSARGALELMAGNDRPTITSMADGIHPLATVEPRAIANLSASLRERNRGLLIGKAVDERDFARFSENNEEFGFAAVKDGRYVAYLIGHVTAGMSAGLNGSGQERRNEAVVSSIGLADANRCGTECDSILRAFFAESRARLLSGVRFTGELSVNEVFMERVRLLASEFGEFESTRDGVFLSFAAGQ